MDQPKVIAYSLLVGDLFHYGHLKMLQTAKQNSDYHICGVISEEVVQKWMSPVICSYEERKEVIDKVKYVDEAVCQDSLDPTRNLKEIRKKYPDAKIVLMANHIMGGNSILGTDFIEEIGGEVVHHDFYSKLSREYIKNSFLKDFSQRKNNIELTDISIGDSDFFQENFSTKANTISNLRKVLKNAKIEREFIFTVGQWKNNQEAIISQIAARYEDNKIVIRSSSLNEDSIDYSNAGHFESILNIIGNDTAKVKESIEVVIDSYNRVEDPSDDNQVLVQMQTKDVAMSGVVFTRNLWTNSPYYLINYDDLTDDTTSVTGGTAISKKIEILRGLPNDLVTKRWHGLIEAVREIEDFFKGLTLDIEFAIRKDGKVVIFQVRPLAANSRFYSTDDELIKASINKIQERFESSKDCDQEILSKELFYSDMAFWNPAELIGDRPNYLDYSLFNHLLMKENWNKGLVTLGYSEVNECLLEFVGGKPYINVHHAFLSLLPQELDKGLKSKLLDFYNEELRAKPELHDKVEFDIVHNCFRFDFENEEAKLLDSGFSKREVEILKIALLTISNSILASYESVLEKDSADIDLLEDKFKAIKQKVDDGLPWNEKIRSAFRLIDDCRTLGTEQFSRVARMAFIASSLLKSLKNKNIATEDELNGFIDSIETVATDIDKAFNQLKARELAADVFIDEYGHLRPGTYDITKLPYSKNEAYLTSEGQATIVEHEKLAFDEKELADKLSQVANEQGIKASGEAILDFIKKATQLREYYKFVYTKNISLAIELVAEVGEELGFSREELANLDFYSIIACRAFTSKEETINIWKNIIAGRAEEKRILDQVSLPPIVYSKKDFVIVPSYISKPNFITDSNIESEAVFLDKTKEKVDLKGKIVVIEKADPGYDWIFNKQIGALVTKYGGAASHMAIRCAEFQIPAAIGCGDLIFSKIQGASKVLIDCKNKTINSL